MKRMLLVWLLLGLLLIASQTQTYERVGMRHVVLGIEQFITYPVSKGVAAVHSQLTSSTQSQQETESLYRRVAELEYMVSKLGQENAVFRNNTSLENNANSENITTLEQSIAFQESDLEKVKSKGKTSVVFKESSWNVSAGRQSGVSEQAFVLHNEYVVGVVSSVGELSSKFLLLKELTVPVAVMVPSKAGGMTEGVLSSRNEGLSLEFVDQQQEVLDGSFVYSATPSETGYPVIFGVVSKKTSDSFELHQSFLVTQLSTIQHGDVVTVLNKVSEGM